VRLLDAYRFVSFRIEAGVNAGAIRSAFRGELSTLPEQARAPAVAVIDMLSQPESLAPALLELGTALDAAGALPEAVSVHLASYELALQRCDAPAGIDAARSAGRAYRKLAEWTESFRWYGLARRLAELEVDLSRLAFVLDGAGNTFRQRGSFPAARAMYRDAWRVAVVSGDRDAIGNVGHSMMTVEREAGRLASAARYGWAALRTQTNSESRANLLLNIGTLLREGGDIQSARDAYHVARAVSADVGIRMMAADGLAYCSALTNGIDYAGWRAVVRRESRGASPYLRAQIGYFRGVSLRAFGRHAAAVRVLRAVERYARAFGLTEWQVKAAEAADEQPLPQPVALETPRELRQGLRELREAAV
jgi:tetratricopeptide (TPR) repeat protein